MVMDFAQEAVKNAEDQGINFDELRAGKASIKVIGTGGCGCNAITWLHNKSIQGAKVYAVNTDALHLSISKADERLLVGRDLTKGLGCGGFPEKGRQAAKESLPELKKMVSDTDMVFVVAGMGGGTGTGVAPVVAQLAKEAGSLVIGVVTMPFETEKARMDKAEFGLEELREHCDTVIVADNSRLVEIAGNLPIEHAFAVANELISTMIKGITETITVPGLVNLDYADVKAIMRNGNMAVIGIGESDTQNRVDEAVTQALTHPLLDIDYKGSNGALIHITGGPDLKLEELTKITELVTTNLAADAQVIFGARIEKSFGNKVRVITIITNVKSPYVLGKPAVGESTPQLEMSDLGIEVFK